MATLKIPYLVAKRGRKLADGTSETRFFWQPSASLKRLGWSLTRLSSTESAAIAQARAINAQLDAWRRGESGIDGITITPDAGPGSLGGLITAYKSSGEFNNDLAEKTKRGYRQNLDVLKDWLKDAPTSAISPKMCKTLYKKMKKKTPSKAAAVIVMGRTLFQWGISEDMITDNPFRQVSIKRSRRTQDDDSHLWTRDAVDLFVEVADRMDLHSLGTAVLINEWLGQREGDILTLSRDVYQNGVIRVRQGKTGARVRLPVEMNVRVAQRLEDEFKRQAKRKVTATTLIVAEGTGRGYKEDNFRHVFARIRTGMAEKWPQFGKLQFMHLRHTAVVRLEEAGCELGEICAITGHSRQTIQQLIDRNYGARTEKMARNAFAKRLESEQE